MLSKFLILIQIHRVDNDLDNDDDDEVEEEAHGEKG